MVADVKSAKLAIRKEVSQISRSWKKEKSRIAKKIRDNLLALASSQLIVKRTVKI